MNLIVVWMLFASVNGATTPLYIDLFYQEEACKTERVVVEQVDGVKAAWCLRVMTKDDSN